MEEHEIMSLSRVRIGTLGVYRWCKQWVEGRDLFQLWFTIIRN